MYRSYKDEGLSRESRTARLVHLKRALRCLRRRLFFPLSGLAMAYVVEVALAQVRLQQDVASAALIVTTLLTAVLLAFLVGMVSRFLAETLIRLPQSSRRRSTRI